MNTINHKDPWEMAETEAIKTARAIIRLKYRILADRELNDVLPELQNTVRMAVSEGTDWRMDVQKLLSDNV